MDRDGEMVGSRDGIIGGWREMEKQLNRKRWREKWDEGKCVNDWIDEEKIV